MGRRSCPGLRDRGADCGGRGYTGGGCRGRMQWDEARPTAGFPAAPADRLYLPQDPAPDRPTVEAQLGDPDSPLERLRRLIRLRRETPPRRAPAAPTRLRRGHPPAAPPRPGPPLLGHPAPRPPPAPPAPPS